MKQKPIKQPSVQLNAFEAQQRAEDGMIQAGDNADYHDPGWQDKAYAFFIQWLFLQPSRHKFFLEEVRLSAAKAAIEEPPDNRAWGNVAVRARKDKLIKTAGYGPSTDVKGHRHPVTIWQKV